ncbi:MAG: phosphatase PAP2 family protein [Pelatocladus maniniholoensis HA4357-MV3]|jgi:undecaprenyl-diphosphatase|uniref:Phosphatase PAP2 family protein n=1 Tax=Pelatocladus maniniholoensis HA4357-MV3 TaxID=1117104 RepID=A0A9E3HD96_9NOST|nr:phosphatase PAP2 family protein [Pelatocladus maniniholoensis HA4357-MV3]
MGLLLSALALWVFAQIADEVLEQETQRFDQSILLAIRQMHTPIGDRVMLGITFLGEPVFLLLICLGIAIRLLYIHRRSQATTLGIAAVGAIGLNYLIKVLFGRVRPQLWNRIVDVGQYSFPSGHAMISLVIYGFIGYLIAKRYRRWRAWIFTFTMILIIAIGFSRLYLGVHWPTDVIAGYAAGVVWLMTCILSLETWRIYRKSGRRSTSNE